VFTVNFVVKQKLILKKLLAQEKKWCLLPLFKKM